MFTRKEIKQNLLGCLEIFLFMGKGVDRFSSDPKAVMKSFALPVALLPILTITFALMSGGYSVSALMSLHLARVALTFVLFIAAVYILSKQFDRAQHFQKFLIASNWFTVVSTIMILPIVIALLSGQDLGALQSYALFMTLAGYVYSAFIITHALRMPWEIGGLIAIIGLAIDQNMLDLTVYVRDLIAIT